MNLEIQIPIETLRQRKLLVATPMFGGMCHGMFTKSCADLAALCAQYQIPLQFYYLFNESLIPRARNYCYDEFLRSEAGHLMFIDADIGFAPQDIIALMALQVQNEQYDIIGAPYPKKSVIMSTNVLTEDGNKTIGWIIDNKYAGRVLSLDQNRNFVWKKVIDWHKYPTDLGKKWVNIGRCGSNHIWMTDDHECYVTNDIMNISIHKKEAKDIKNKYIICNPIENKKHSINPLYNSEQMSFLIGTLMGDGCITKGHLKFGHSDKQLDYLNLKQELFGGKIGNKRISNKYITQGNLAVQSEEHIYYAYHLDCPRNAQIEKLQELFYSEGKKSVKNIIHLLDEKGLAFWYMDDGNLHQKNIARFCTDSFTYEEHELIQKYFNDKWNIKSSIIKHKNKYRLNILAESSSIFFTIIGKYIPFSMEYKLPENYRGWAKHQFNTKKLDYGAVQIKNIQYFDELCADEQRKQRKKFEYQCDITVEDTHNFVAENFVVSNCISWEKIKLAVDKGMADEDPTILDKFVGDYVFNPKYGQQAIPIGEPVEVLEIGTGMMMIRKESAIKFNAFYPQYMYRPDHARTEHFDGSREIMQAFQSEIDGLDFGAFYEKEVKRITEMRINDSNVLQKEIEQVVKTAWEMHNKKSKRYLSEDYWYCQKAQEANLKTWLCLYQNDKIETEYGIKSLKWIHKNGYYGKVLSFDGKDFVWKKIIRHILNDNLNKEWIKVNTSSHQGTKLICTTDHPIAIVENPFQLNIDYIEAIKAKDKWLVTLPKENKNDALFNEQQLSVSIGCLLGDGHINKRTGFAISHCIKQKEYLEYKQSILGGEITKINFDGYKKDNFKYNLWVGINAQIKYLRELFYINNKRTIKNIVPFINDISLAFWYLDDGSIKRKDETGTFIHLHTEGLSYEDHLIMKKMFKDKWNIDVNIHERIESNKKYNYLYIGTHEVEKLMNIIIPYVPHCMSYKIPNEYSSMPSKVITNEKLNYALGYIKDLIPYKEHNIKSKLYDLEIEDTHNLVVNKSLVHNCPWMKTQHCGSFIFGGSLADLASIGASATVDPSQLKKGKQGILPTAPSSPQIPQATQMLSKFGLPSSSIEDKRKKK